MSDWQAAFTAADSARRAAWAKYYTTRDKLDAVALDRLVLSRVMYMAAHLIDLGRPSLAAVELRCLLDALCIDEDTLGRPSPIEMAQRLGELTAEARR